MFLSNRQPSETHTLTHAHTYTHLSGAPQTNLNYSDISPLINLSQCLSPDRISNKPSINKCLNLDSEAISSQQLHTIIMPQVHNAISSSVTPHQSHQLEEAQCKTITAVRRSPPPACKETPIRTATIEKQREYATNNRHNNIPKSTPLAIANVRNASIIFPTNNYANFAVFLDVI